MHRIRQAVGSVLVAGAVAGGATAATSGANLTLVAYSTPRDAYAQLIPAFQETPAGKDVTFTQSYGASGDQSRAVLNGLKADVVALLARSRHAAPRRSRGSSRRTGTRTATTGMVTDSVVVFVRPHGNPKHIKGWDDLVKPGVEVITPNPFTSGGARWNVMAAYGAQLQGRARRRRRLRRYLGEAVQERLGAGQERARVAADVRQRQGRRPDRLRERGDLRAGEGRCRSST